MPIKACFCTGWHRMALLVLYFAPDTLRVPANFDAVSERLLVRRACCARCFFHRAKHSASRDVDLRSG